MASKAGYGRPAGPTGGQDCDGMNGLSSDEVMSRSTGRCCLVVDRSPQRHGVSLMRGQAIQAALTFSQSQATLGRRRRARRLSLKIQNVGLTKPRRCRSRAATERDQTSLVRCSDSGRATNRSRMAFWNRWPSASCSRPPRCRPPRVLNPIRLLRSRPEADSMVVHGGADG